MRLIAADVTLLLIHVQREDTAANTDPLLVDFLFIFVFFSLPSIFSEPQTPGDRFRIKQKKRKKKGEILNMSRNGRICGCFRKLRYIEADINTVNR